MKIQNELSIAAPQLAPQSRVRTGRGSAIAHHGEILQGVFVNSEGCLCRGLVSLLCDLLRSQATFYPDSTGVVNVEPAYKLKALQAARLTLAHLDAQGVGGRLKITSTIPLRWGLGSSTSDVTSAVRAVADVFMVNLCEEEIARVAIKAEVASDPLMFGNRAILFAHRNGSIIKDLGGTLPALEIVGFNTDASGNGIDTLNFPPARYTWWEIEAFRPLVGLMRQAVASQSARLIGRVASASARINQRHLPTPNFDRLEKLGEEVGAVGIQVAHSGTVAGLIFDPHGGLLDERIECCRARLAELGIDEIWQFQTGREDKVTIWEPYELTNQLPKRLNSLELYS